MLTSPTAIETRTVTAEPISAASFAPFGVVLSPENHERLPINPYGDRVDIFRESFESDQPIEWFIVRFWLRGYTATFLERHHEITQSFIPVGGHPFVLVVARPEAREEDGLPALDEVHAFVVPGDRGVQLHRSTWHENPLPLVDGQVVLVSSHQSLTRGHVAHSDKSLASLKLDVEKRNVAEVGGFKLQVTLP